MYFSISYLLPAALFAGIANAAPIQYGQANAQSSITNIQLGPRPYYLVDNMTPGPLKEKLESCTEKPVGASDFSISHRGAPLQFPEHTKEAYLAAARMGAGYIECDVAFTKDRELVCRHSQCDLHTTTNILAFPELAEKCTKPFTPATGHGPASAQCCTSDITLAEFKSLCGKMDAHNASATTPEDYMNGTPGWRTDLYSSECGTLASHKEYLALVDSLGRKFTSELKTPEVEMPFMGSYTQEMYAQQLVDEYKAANIDAERTLMQSFLIDDIYYWLKNDRAYGMRAIYLDDLTNDDYTEAVSRFPDLAKNGVSVVAPPIFALLALDEENRIVPSEYAKAANASGLDMITWSFERSGPLSKLKGSQENYYMTVIDALNNEGDMYSVIDVLARDVGVIGLFSDWPASVTYYANCFGL